MTDQFTPLALVAAFRVEVKRHGRVRLLTAMVALACTGTTGAAVSIKTVVNSDPAACGSLLAMVKAAGVLNMSDEQLCDFRFARLPPSQTKGFAFPTWTVLSVDDAPAMYFRLLHANLAPDEVSNYGYPWSDQINAARQAAADNNLVFYKTELQLEGKGSPLTFVQMDIKQCSKRPYLKVIGFPAYAVFDQFDLKNPLPVKPSWTSDTQIFLWESRIPVEINITNQWFRIDDRSKAMQITMQGLARSAMDGVFHGAIHDYPVCAFNILNTAKSHKEARP
jgi:hypothetical protein